MYRKDRFARNDDGRMHQVNASSLLARSRTVQPPIAVCRARQGDSAGAREDLERYLRLHPQGRFAAEARQVLGR